MSVKMEPLRSEVNEQRKRSRPLTLHGVLGAPQHALLHGRQQQLFELRVGHVPQHGAALVQHVLLGPRLAHQDRLHVQVQQGTLREPSGSILFLR